MILMSPVTTENQEAKYAKIVQGLARVNIYYLCSKFGGCETAYCGGLDERQGSPLGFRLGFNPRQSLHLCAQNRGQRYATGPDLLLNYAEGRMAKKFSTAASGTICLENVFAVGLQKIVFVRTTSVENEFPHFYGRSRGRR